MSAVGEVIMWSGTLGNIPAGFLHCDGRLLDTSQYSDLYVAIGNNFGNSPPNGQFYLPDLRGRFIRGVDDGANRDPDADTRVDMQNGELFSKGVGSVQSDAYTNHTHGYMEPAYPSKQAILNANSDDGWGPVPASTDAPVDAGGGSSASSETRPLNAYLYFLICWQASS